jgi:hypothetical protein
MYESLALLPRLKNVGRTPHFRGRSEKVKQPHFLNTPPLQIDGLSMKVQTLIFKALVFLTWVAVAFPAQAASQVTVYASLVYNAASSTLPWTATTIYNRAIHASLVV